MKKIAVFTGTRAEYGLLYWLMRDIESDEEFVLQLLVSGSHLSPEFGMTYKEIEKDGFAIDDRVEMILSSDTPVGVAKSMGIGMLGYAESLSRLKPDALVILGDRFEALAVAQTALILRIPIVHLHGGEITEGAYDDSIRHAITKLSYLHGTSTETYRRRVIQMGEAPERVYNVGAIGLDHLKRTLLMDRAELSSALGFSLTEKYFVITYHPVTLGKNSSEHVIRNLLSALNSFPDYRAIITYPNADDGGREIIPVIQNFARINPVRVLAVESLGQVKYLSAIKNASAVVGNSSSGIIEAPAFDVPTVNVGDRQKGRLAAKSVLNCGENKHEIESAISRAIQQSYKIPGEKIINPYGYGESSAKVIQMLKKLPIKINKRFFDIEIKNNW
jgi:UDP-hydrolysing UDP-N-acetyl-D-glucosamine 2-epimerase